ncbi:hypothetical protein COI95_08700 [Bacillus cereus]|nr:hypothetical protein COI95_08700 [Bacillus cereus]
MIYKIGDFLIRSKDIIIINDNEYYQRVTVRMNHNGVIQRDKVLGSKIKTKRQYVVKPGQFIMSRIDARHGAFGIIPDELDGAIITGDFLAFDIDTNKVNLEYFTDLTKSPQFIQFCIDSSTGTTNRKRLKEELFLAFEIEVPNKAKQDKIVDEINKVKFEYKNLETQLEQKEILVDQLRGAMLQDAIKGKLVPQDENDEPASVLLEKIMIEKNQLIKEKKIKKEKPLPEIIDKEIPFELPVGWGIVRFGDIAVYKKGPFGSSITKSMFVPKSETTAKVYEQKNAIYQNSELGEYYISKEKFNELKNFEVFPNDIIVSCAGTIGKTFIMPEDIQPGIINQALMKITLSDYIDKNFFLIYFDYILSSEITEKSKGSAMKNIPPLKLLKNIVFVLPPLEEQKRIVKKVNQLMSLCDELEVNIEQSRLESETLMKALLQEAFTVKEEVLN